MDGFKINGKKDWEDLIKSSHEKFLETRKSAHDFFLKNPEKWSELHKIVLEYDESKPVSVKYASYDKQLNDLFYFRQIFYFVRNPATQEEIPEVTEVDVLALGIFPDVISFELLNKEVYNEAFVFCDSIEYSEKNLFRLYEKFIGKIGENYPSDFVEYSKVLEKEKELLDAVFFWSKYRYKDFLMSLFKEVKEK